MATMRIGLLTTIILGLAGLASSDSIKATVKKSFAKSLQILIEGDGGIDTPVLVTVENLQEKEPVGTVNTVGIPQTIMLDDLKADTFYGIRVIATKKIGKLSSWIAGMTGLNGREMRMQDIIDMKREVTDKQAKFLLQTKVPNHVTLRVTVVGECPNREPSNVHKMTKTFTSKDPYQEVVFKLKPVKNNQTNQTEYQECTRVNETVWAQTVASGIDRFSYPLLKDSQVLEPAVRSNTYTQRQYEPGNGAGGRIRLVWTFLVLEIWMTV